MSVRVTAPCRLHFGLFHVPVEGLTHWPDGTPVRKFGGVGMMVENPQVVVECRRADKWSSGGSLAGRALVFAKQVEAWWAERVEPKDRHHYTVVADGPPEHAGLGIGTALGMAITAARIADVPGLVASAHQKTGTSPLITGRGQRSGIGLHGFWTGGLLIDPGKWDDNGQASSCGRVEFTPDWKVVLIRPPVVPVWHGDKERSAFGRNRLPEQALNTTNRLMELAHKRIVPAVTGKDFDAFSDAVFAFNRLAGEPFAADQGGPYSSMPVTCVIDELLGWGVTGVGQSSWGPTVFAFARDPDEADHLAARARAWLPSDADVTVTAANNTGAKLEVLE